MVKRTDKKKKGRRLKNESFRFETIRPLNELFPQKLLKEKLNDIKNNKLVRDIGKKVKSSMQIVGDQAMRFGKTAKEFALQTKVHVKIAQYNAEINKLYMAIGEEVYERTKSTGQTQDNQGNVPQLIQKINSIDKEISDLEKKLS